MMFVFQAKNYQNPTRSECCIKTYYIHPQWYLFTRSEKKQMKVVSNRMVDLSFWCDFISTVTWMSGNFKRWQMKNVHRTSKRNRRKMIKQSESHKTWGSVTNERFSSVLFTRRQSQTQNFANVCAAMGITSLEMA